MGDQNNVDEGDKNDIELLKLEEMRVVYKND